MVSAPSSWRRSTVQAPPFFTPSRLAAGGEAAVVAPGDDPVALPGEVPVKQPDAAGFYLPGSDSVGASSSGQCGDVRAAERGHEGDLPVEHVGFPALVGGLGHGLPGP